MPIAQVAIPLPFDAIFSYSVPQEMEGKISVGQRVIVPLGGRKEVMGYVVGFNTEATQDVKPILRTLDEIPIFPQEMIPLYQWLSQYYIYPIGKVINETLPFKGKRKASVQVTQVQRPESLDGLSMEEQRLLVSTQAKKRGFAYKLPVIEGLIKKGYLAIREPEIPYGEVLEGETAPIHLNSYQKKAIEEICAAIESNRFQVFLLHGVTGSGKTQVYIHALTKTLSMGRSAIFIVPEIALSIYMESLLRSIFGHRLSVYHSGLKDTQRQSLWLGMLWGHYKIVLGARSAVFAPFKDLGLIIVDEEHEDSYKQGNGLRYNGRDVAVLRAMISGCPVILGSATPSIRSFFNAQNGKYQLLEMPKRVEQRPLPTIEVVDMAALRKDTKSFTLISPRMQEAIFNTLKSGRQVIVFHSRRGFFRMFLCQRCGSILKCPDCELSLIYHLDVDSLVCHCCNKTLPVLRLCPYCKKETLKAYGYGTERIVEELKTLFSEWKIERVDTDALRNKDIMKIIEEFKANNIHILVGTQIITKGYDFPNVTLVCVISSDLLLNFPDYRASERTFNTIAQVAGRSGRGDDPGLVIVQTYNSWHHSIRFAIEHNYRAFYETEIPIRQRLFYPPFSHIVMITFSGTQKVHVFETAKRLKGKIDSRIQSSSLRNKALINGPTPNPISKMKAKYRFHLLLKTSQIMELTSMLKELNIVQELPKDVKATIDVDPYDML